VTNVFDPETWESPGGPEGSGGHFFHFFSRVGSGTKPFRDPPGRVSGPSGTGFRDPPGRGSGRGSGTLRGGVPGVSESGFREGFRTRFRDPPTNVYV
jgi:hypothetical protein